MAQSLVLCPSCWGKVQFITKPYCPVLGTPFRFAVGEDFLSGEALQNPPVFDHSRAAVLHKGLAQKMVSDLKYHGRLDMAPLMAQWMFYAGHDLLSVADYIVPLPLHRRRFWQRGYNQSAEIARPIAKLTAKPFAPQLLVRKKYTLPQVGLTAKKRAENLRGVFAVKKQMRVLLENKNILLIDDVYTTGATAKAAARALKHAGAARVDVLTFSRVVKEEF